MTTATSGQSTWHLAGDAFVARRLRETIAPGARVSASGHVGAARVTLVATSRGIARVLIDGEEAIEPDEPALRNLATLVARCLVRWQPAAAELPLDVSGTPFQLATWQALRGIRPGSTRSYGDVARALGKAPMAARAVGQAVGANPVPILVPCHRVLAAGGAIGGFAGGLQMKRMLLRAEGVQA